ncbi:hypothetical protein Dtox_0120 [Desulfofarcimen acetoxidans DSM 771]|uniref:Wadjet protein JetD C-terminal domain-containing protein n=1 Tax=Desulfofarcimen acetoxidans (strain ATCC 49208 / DSM 771 / KCTC 5769 / VKM B-1644 / 5575) TaxID=485916 RepID=C8W2S7_DESAS|nr:DUF2399 domain-containing protein [Desulfofarcimen acetoxidans]ACV61083.1 hypothetical protein Dtox_0120 [Desulfofarcimen acetoxidans DSM 771]
MLPENIVLYLQKYLARDETISSKDATIRDRVYSLSAKTIKSRVSYTSKIFELSGEASPSIPPAFQGSRWQNKKTAKQLKNWLNYRNSSLSFELNIRNWVENGLLIRVIELANRGTSSKGVYFIPGLPLIESWNKKELSENNANRKEADKYMLRLEALVNPYDHPGFEKIRNFARREVRQNLRVDKRAEFLLSLLSAAQTMPFFDWKEIGTFSETENMRNAASKTYDGKRTLYQTLLEEILQDSPEAIGLTTVSGNYALSFSARCRIDFTFGRWDFNECPVISNISGEEIAEIISLQAKDVHTLFLTENRAVLRKLAGHMPHEKRRHVGMIAFDGQIRSAVYNFLKIWQAAGLNKLLVWTDFDQAAIYMLKKLYGLGFADFNVLVPKEDELTLLDYPQAISMLEEFIKENMLVEQESYLKDMRLLQELIFNC